MELFIVFLFFLFLALYKASKPSKRKKPKPSKNTTRKNPPQPVYEWLDEGDQSDIVGESHYQDAIKILAGSNDEHVYNKEYQALLIPENNNPHDKKAVRVDIEGMTVGYLSREDAPDFRDNLRENKLTGKVTACKAVVTGGRGRNGEKLSYGIRLKLYYPEY